MMKKIYFILLTLLIPAYLFGISGSGTSGDPYYGTISTSETWNSAEFLSGEVYVGQSSPNDDLTIGNGGHLTINNGVTVIFTQTSSDLIITGTGRLTVNGTSTNMVTFTKATGNSYWGHISFQSMGSADGSIIDYCIIEYGDVSGNSGAAAYGGGIHVDFSDLTISNSIIRDNEAAWGGGIFVNQNDSPTISNCLIKDNDSDHGGGGIYCWNGAGLIVKNCIFDGNRCNETSTSYYTGGGIAGQTGTSIKVLNCTFVNNTSNQTNGQSILLHSSNSAKVINSIVWGSGNEIYLLNTNTVSIVNCAVEGTGASGYVNSIDLDASNTASDGPNFVSESTPDWSIEFISPCRDIGTDTYTGVTIPSTDYDGKNRIGTTDIGAYEVQYSRWTGTTNTTWATATNWDESLDPTSSTGDVIIPSDLTNYPNITTTQDFTIASDKTMIIESEAQVTLDVITNNGTLTLESDADGIASLLVDTYTDAGTENIELFITGGGSPNYKWHYISSPVDNLGIATFTGTTTNLLKYDEGLVDADNASLGWRFYDGYDYLNTTQDANTFSVLDLGKGYDLYNGSDHTFTLSGTFNTASVSNISLNYNSGSHTELPAIHGLNLLGNPFTCSLDWDVIDNTLDANISKAIYYTKDNGVASWVNGVGTNNGTNIIPPMQGFFVKTTTTGTTITLPTGARKHDSQARYKSAKSIPLVRLVLQNDLFSDETVIRLDDNATDSFDNDFDAYKMMISETSLLLWSNLNDIKYCINGVPFPENSMEIPLVINSPGADSLKITATQIQGLEDYDLILKDLDQSVSVDLNQVNEYLFAADSGTVTDRFILTITNLASGLPDIIEPEPEKAFNIYSIREILYISPAKNEWNGKRGDLRIYDITGKLVKQQKNIEWYKGVTKEISLNVAQGIYVVEIRSANERFVGKVGVLR